jgi:hypothetical protein
MALVCSFWAASALYWLYITQIENDSPSARNNAPIAHRLGFVGAAHDYPHGLADSRTALRLVRPGGVVLWHDFNAHFPGLVHAIIEAAPGLPLKRLGIHTMLAFLPAAG